MNQGGLRKGSECVAVRVSVDDGVAEGYELRGFLRMSWLG
jgi:hypothetical protein